MMIFGQRFPETSRGYRGAARHVEKLTPGLYSDARELRDVAYSLQRREMVERYVRLGMAVIIALALTRAVWNWLYN